MKLYSVVNNCWSEVPYPRENLGWVKILSADADFQNRYLILADSDKNAHEIYYMCKEGLIEPETVQWCGMPIKVISATSGTGQSE